jgi:hypothetical protein
MCREREADLNQINSITQQEADDLVGFLRLRMLTRPSLPSRPRMIPGSGRAVRLSDRDPVVLPSIAIITATVVRRKDRPGNNFMERGGWG